jgi:DNA invertase Pin-like site-specific DNA recombinase
MTEAVSYLRVSSEGQISGDGFPRQREKIQSYATQNAISILEEFRDEGVTGKMELEGREGLSKCLEYVRVHEIKIVLIEDSTRLARDMIVSEVVIREFQKIGVHVISASGGVDLTEGDDSNPTAKLIRQILAAVSEFDRCCINIKLRVARERKRAATGKCEGRIRYGEKPGEDTVLHQMRSLKAAGLSCDRIADALNANGVPARGTKKKTGPWLGCTIARILKREATSCETT